MQRSQDVIAGTLIHFDFRLTFSYRPDITSLVQNLSADFTAEIKSKQDAFDVTQAHLRAATRELAEQRRHIQLWQSKCAQLDQVAQRTRNLEKALLDEDHIDWVEQKLLNDGNRDIVMIPEPGAISTGKSNGLSLDSLSTSVQLPPENTATSFVRLRQIREWQGRVDTLINARIASLKGASAEKEFQCKKIVAMCTGVPIDKVEDVRMTITLIKIPITSVFYRCLTI